MQDYTFEMMYEDLRNGYQIYYTYVKNKVRKNVKRKTPKTESNLKKMNLIVLKKKIL